MIFSFGAPVFSGATASNSHLHQSIRLMFAICQQQEINNSDLADVLEQALDSGRAGVMVVISGD